MDSCRFYALGRCRYGSSCRFWHDPQHDNMQPGRPAAGVPACRYFAAGTCAFGDVCRFRHVKPAVAAAAPPTSGTATRRGGARALAAPTAASTGAAPAGDGRPECAVCLDVPKGRYALMQKCDHVFCLPCMSEWRQTTDETQSKETVRQCPLCRVHSDFVVPSPRHLAGDARERFIAKYLENAKKIPCKFYRKNGVCPQKEWCHYAHVDTAANRGKAQAAAKAARKREKRRRRRDRQVARQISDEEILNSGGTWADGTPWDPYASMWGEDDDYMPEAPSGATRLFAMLASHPSALGMGDDASNARVLKELYRDHMAGLGMDLCDRELDFLDPYDDGLDY